MKRIALAVLALVASSAFAADTQNTLAVSANVNALCAVTGGNISFGVYRPTGVNATAPRDSAPATIAVTCTNTTGWTLTLDVGQNPTGNATGPSRAMSDGGTSFLQYELYSDAPGGTVFPTLTGTGTGTAQTYSVYGQIPANQQVAPGSYADTVTINVNY